MRNILAVCGTPNRDAYSSRRTIYEVSAAVGNRLHPARQGRARALLELYGTAVPAVARKESLNCRARTKRLPGRLFFMTYSHRLLNGFWAVPYEKYIDDPRAVQIAQGFNVRYPEVHCGFEYDGLTNVSSCFGTHRRGRHVRGVQLLGRQHDISS